MPDEPMTQEQTVNAIADLVEKVGPLLDRNPMHIVAGVLSALMGDLLAHIDHDEWPEEMSRLMSSALNFAERIKAKRAEPHNDTQH